jgi:hypothetical protein
MPTKRCRSTSILMATAKHPKESSTSPADDSVIRTSWLCHADQDQRIVTKSLWFISTCTRFSRARRSASADGFTGFAVPPEKLVRAEPAVNLSDCCFRNARHSDFSSAVGSRSSTWSEGKCDKRRGSLLRMDLLVLVRLTSRPGSDFEPTSADYCSSPVIAAVKCFPLADNTPPDSRCRTWRGKSSSSLSTCGSKHCDEPESGRPPDRDPLHTLSYRADPRRKTLRLE